MRASFELAPDSSSPRRARMILRGLLVDDAETTIATAELLVTELVTNAIVHTGTGPRLDVELTDDCLRVSVHDGDPAPPVRRHPKPTVPGGRGIVILEELSDHWGVRPARNGKVVWFELARRR